MARKLKLSEDGKYALINEAGQAILDDGKDTPLDHDALIGKVKELSDLRDKWERDEKPAIAAKVAFLERLGKSPAEIEKAVRTVESLGDEKLAAAGKLDEVLKERLEAGLKVLRDENATLKAQVNDTQGKLRHVTISRSFRDLDPKIRENWTITGDIAEAMFGGHVDDDGNVYHDVDKKSRIYSDAKPGEAATFEEGIFKLLSVHPRAGDIKKGVNGAGGGAPGGAKGQNNGAKVMPRTQFTAMTPAAQMEFISAGGDLTE